MDVTYDPAKSGRNVRERGLSFDRAAEFDFMSAVIGPVFRNGEHRWQAIGYLEDRLHVICFKKTDTGIRVISFRRANEREAKRYELKIRR